MSITLRLVIYGVVSLFAFTGGYKFGSYKVQTYTVKQLKAELTAANQNMQKLSAARKADAVALASLNKLRSSRNHYKDSLSKLRKAHAKQSKTSCGNQRVSSDFIKLFMDDKN